MFEFEDGVLCTDEIVSGPGGGTFDKTVTGLSDCVGVGVSMLWWLFQL